MDADDDDLERECEVCSGYGFYHDCGEEVCCCADPSEDDVVQCEFCGGTGLAVTGAQTHD